MRNEAVILKQLQVWGWGEPRIRALLLTSSRAHLTRQTDLFSDYDVIVVATDLESLLRNADWLHIFGAILARFDDTLQQSGQPQYMRLVLYEDGVKIDFSLWSVATLAAIVAAPRLPAILDAGYRVLLDKDSLTMHLHPPSYTAYVPPRPTAQDYQKLVGDFWWETTYVAKNLWRDDLFFAKYNLDYVIRFELVLPMLEWYIESHRDWSWQPGLLGKGIKHQVDATLWSEIERTVVGADRADNWRALFATIDLFRKFALHVAQTLQYDYPTELDAKVTNYLLKVRGLAGDAPALE